MVKERTAGKEKAKGIASLLGAVLLVAKIIADTFFGFEIPQELIDQTVNVVLSVITVIAAWRNNYITQKGKSQFNLLKNAKLD